MKRERFTSSVDTGAFGPPKSVFTHPGQNETTRIPSLCRSLARFFVIMFKAAYHKKVYISNYFVMHAIKIIYMEIN